MSRDDQDSKAGSRRAHSTPDPESPPSKPETPPVPTTPDDVPAPAHAPVQEPRMPEPPIRAA